MAAQDFEAITDFKGIGKDSKNGCGHQINEAILCQMWRVAIAMLVMTKPELIVATRSLDEEKGFEVNADLMDRLTDAKKLTEECTA
jgi:hypothetical protein